MYHFILTPYSLHTQVITILILIDVQYLQNVASSFEKVKITPHQIPSTQ